MKVSKKTFKKIEAIMVNYDHESSDLAWIAWENDCLNLVAQQLDGANEELSDLVYCKQSADDEFNYLIENDLYDDLFDQTRLHLIKGVV